LSARAFVMNRCSLLNRPTRIMSRGATFPKRGLGVLNHKTVFCPSLKYCATNASATAHSLTRSSSSFGIFWSYRTDCTGMFEALATSFFLKPGVLQPSGNQFPRTETALDSPLSAQYQKVLLHSSAPLIPYLFHTSPMILPRTIGSSKARSPLAKLTLPGRCKDHRRPAARRQV